VTTKLRKVLREKLKDYCLVLAAIVAALVVLLTPLQLYMPLGRYQHYGLCVFVLGMGYILQIVWSWRSLKRWPRLGYTATALYLCSVGMVLYANPWLDARMAVITEQKENLRALIGWTYTIFGVILAFIYLEWMQADYRGRRRKGRKH